MYKAETITILAVEDDLVSLKMTTQSLTSEGYQVIACQSGEDALRIIASQTEDIGLILLDVMMPGMDGLTLIQHIRSPKYAMSVPILLVTGLDHPSGVERALSLGANDYMTKPFHPIELRARVRNLLRIRNYQRQLEEYNTIMQRDLEVARELQQGLIPQSPFLGPEVRLAWRYLPCFFVGGDMVNLFSLNDRQMGFYVADVSGHGVASAMLSTWLYHALQPTMEQKKSESPAVGSFQALPLTSPRSVAISLDDRITEKNGANYITLCYGIYHTVTRTLNYIRCGHPYPILLTHNKKCHPLEDSNSPAIGMSFGLPFQSHSVRLNSGDRVYFYSDALFEAKDAEGEAFGMDRLCSQIVETSQYQIENQLNIMLRSIQKYQGKKEFDDDVTLLVLEVP